MASPHVAGAAALLRQRHPAWTVAELKSALVETGVDSVVRGRPAGPRFQGGGVIALQRADQPLLFASPTAVSLGLLSRGQTVTRTVGLDDAGGGSGTWQVGRVVRNAPAGVRLELPATITVPGELTVSASTTRAARPGDLDAYIQLRHGAEVRRVPLWGRVDTQALAGHRPGVALHGVGLHRATTAGRAELVTRYRYPDNPTGVGLTTALRGPELVYLVGMGRGIANFGVVITGRAKGSTVEPRVVADFDENRLTGYAGLPLNHNPYMDAFQRPLLAAGALSPAPGPYAIVFDSATPAGAGAFTFRFWVNDVTPPTLRLRTKVVGAGQEVRVAAVDKGSGVYADSIAATVDGDLMRASYRSGVVSLSTRGLARGAHRLRLRVSDVQESKNTENVARILPNTRWLTATFRVR